MCKPSLTGKPCIHRVGGPTTAAADATMASIYLSNPQLDPPLPPPPLPRSPSLVPSVTIKNGRFYYHSSIPGGSPCEPKTTRRKKRGTAGKTSPYTPNNKQAARGQIGSFGARKNFFRDVCLPRKRLQTVRPCQPCKKCSFSNKAKERGKEFGTECVPAIAFSCSRFPIRPFLIDLTNSPFPGLSVRPDPSHNLSPFPDRNDAARFQSPFLPSPSPLLFLQLALFATCPPASP